MQVKVVYEYIRVLLPIKALPATCLKLSERLSRGQKPTLNHFTESWHMVNVSILLIMLFKGADCNVKAGGWIRLGDRSHEMFWAILKPTSAYCLCWNRVCWWPDQYFLTNNYNNLAGKTPNGGFLIQHASFKGVLNFVMLIDAVIQISGLSTFSTFSIIYQLSCLLIWTCEFSVSWVCL